MGMNLRAVFDAADGQAEGLHGPGQVVLALKALAEGKAFAEGRLVDLDDVDAG